MKLLPELGQMTAWVDGLTAARSTLRESVSVVSVRDILSFAWLALRDGFNSLRVEWAEDLERTRRASKEARKAAEERRLPGHDLHALSESLFSRKTHTTVFEPVLRDLQDEYQDALKGGDRIRARWVALRGVLSFWAAVVQYLYGSVIRWVAKLAKPY